MLIKLFMHKKLLRTKPTFLPFPEPSPSNANVRKLKSNPFITSKTSFDSEDGTLMDQFVGCAASFDWPSDKFSHVWVWLLVKKLRIITRKDRRSSNIRRDLKSYLVGFFGSRFYKWKKRLKTKKFWAHLAEWKAGRFVRIQ